MAGRQRLISCLHPCSTSNVVLNSRTALMGHYWTTSTWAGCHTPPSKNLTSSSGQLTHTGKCPGPPPLSARPYVQCRRHMPCRVSHPGPHAPCAICPHTDPYAQLRGSALIPFVTPCPPKPHRPALPRGGHAYTYHPAYTFVLASCKRINPRVVWLEDKGL